MRCKPPVIRRPRGPAIGRPADTRLAMTTAGAAKPRAPHRHYAKQRYHPTKPPVLDVTRLTTSRAIRTQNRVIVRLHGDHRLLQARQDLLCLGQRQPQVRDIAESTARPDIHYVDDPCRTVDPRFNQTIGQSYRPRPHPPIFWTLPCPADDSLSAGWAGRRCADMQQSSVRHFWPSPASHPEARQAS
jgi:hypothetical protein